MIKEKHPNYLPKSKVAELRTSNGSSVSESVNPVDIVLNEQVGQLGQYHRPNMDDEWKAFQNLISK